MKTNFLIIISAAVMLASCGDAAPTVQVETKPVVKLKTAQLASVEQLAQFTGTIEPFLLNNISPSLGLRIDKIHVDVGHKVKKGQLVVEMDKRQYLQSAVQMSNLESDLNRTKRLYEEGGVSKQQLDQLQTQLTVSRHAADNLLENANLISPISGIVTERLFDPGDVYTQGAGKILTIMQLDKVKVKVNVSEQYYPQVKVGMPIDITLDIYPDVVFAGKVSLIYPALDASTHTFPVEITINNGDMRLRPGMFCRVALNFGKANRIVVEDIAVQKQIGTNERYVFTVDAANKVERKEVKIGRVIDHKYEILSGVNDGDQVVVAGMSKLNDGVEVEVVN